MRHPCRHSFVPCFLLVLFGFVGATSPAAAQEDVMTAMQELDIAFAGIATDIPERQYLGERDAPQGRIVYMWNAVQSPDDRVSREHLLGVRHLRLAGIPALDGSSVDLEQPIFGNRRYRMAGVLTSIDIRGEARYEVRVNLDWTLYDSQAGSVIWEGSTGGMARGAVLGDRGEQPNAMMDAVIDALESALDDEVSDAIEAS